MSCKDFATEHLNFFLRFSLCGSSSNGFNDFYLFCFLICMCASVYVCIIIAGTKIQLNYINVTKTLITSKYHKKKEPV